MLDIIIVVFVGLGMIGGFRSGLIRQAVGLAGLVVAIGLGMRYGESVGTPIVSALDMAPDLASLAGFFVIFMAVAFATTILGRVITAMAKGLQLSGINKLVGALFGGLKSAVLIGAVLICAALWDLPSNEMRTDSRLYAPLMEGMAFAWQYFSDTFPDAIGSISTPETL